MPFGLTNVPASFQWYINEVLGELLDTFVIAYLDDILIFSTEPEEHQRHVMKVLTKLQRVELQLKLSKCEFHIQDTEFLGHHITMEGIHTDPAKIQAIQEWPTPRNIKDIQKFLGLINYYQWFIDGYLKWMTPITKLLQGQQSFEWNEA